MTVPPVLLGGDAMEQRRSSLQRTMSVFGIPSGVFVTVEPSGRAAMFSVRLDAMELLVK